MKKIILSILTVATMAISVKAQIPTASLVGHYDFSNGALTDNINSVNFTKTGTASTNITDRFGNANEAISLNGDDLLRPDIDFNINSNPYLARTISFWVKTSTNDGNSRLIYNDNSRTNIGAFNYNGLIVYLQNGQIKASNRVGSNGNLVAHTVSVNDNNWHHVAIQAFSTSIAGTKRFYTYVFIDGVKEGGNGYQSSASGLSVTANEYIGDLGFSRLANSSLSSSQKYEDGLDEVLFYKRILTDSEVNNITTNNPNACTVNIPDANFKAYLVGLSAINTNGNAEIECSEASAFSGILNCSSLSISDLTGIEAFTNMIRLYCSLNSISTMDVSSNTALTHLVCDNNTLTSLDVSNNTNLISLICYNNSLTDLNVSNGNNSNISLGNFSSNNNPNLTCITVDNVTYSTTTWTQIDAQTNFSTNCNAPCTVNIPDVNFKAYLVGNTAINTNGNSEIECSEASSFTGTINCPGLSISDLTGIEAFPALTVLICENNLLSSLDISQNVALTNLKCGINSLTNLNVSNNIALTTLWFYANSIASIDLSNNNNLEFLSCWGNILINIDVSMNTALTRIYCQNNALTSLNVANGSNNNFLQPLTASGNPNLTCIQVDDVAYSTANWSSIDAQTSFSTNCSTLGISEFEKKVINIYPNPVKNQLFIELDNQEVTEMVIIDYSGRIVKTVTNNTTKSIDVSGLTQGIYILKVSTENGIYTNRFIKQ